VRSERPARRHSVSFLLRQRKAVEALRRDLERESGTLGHPYFRDYRAWSRRDPEPASREDLLGACGRSRVIYVADFHADPDCAVFAAGLLESLATRIPGVGLGVEFAFTRQQGILDLRQAGRLDDAEFQRRIHYDEQWGFPWTGYRELLDRARALEVPVFALDRGPRGGASQLSARDDHAARRIVRILTEGRADRLLVFFGESHVSPGRLPRRVRTLARRSGLDAAAVVVLQDPEETYWRSLAAGAIPPRYVRLGEECFATFHTSPLERYERHRQVMDRWRGETAGELDSDFTPLVHHLIDVLARWLGVRPDRRRVPLGGGWSESLRDCYPEVYSGADASGLLASILHEHGRREEEIREAERRFTEREALYEPRSNTFFMARFLPGPASGEAARFLHAALSGRLFRWPAEEGGDPAERAYGHAYNEALAFLGARLIDPASSPETADRAGRPEGVPKASVRLAWLERHRAFERSGDRHPPEGLLAPLRGDRVVRRALARDLGHRLGAELYGRVRSNRISRIELRGLFSKTLDPPHARRWVLDLFRNP
jgi:hypothetical protein